MHICTYRHACILTDTWVCARALVHSRVHRHVCRGVVAHVYTHRHTCTSTRPAPVRKQKPHVTVNMGVSSRFTRRKEHQNLIRKRSCCPCSPLALTPVPFAGQTPGFGAEGHNTEHRHCACYVYMHSCSSTKL